MGLINTMNMISREIIAIDDYLELMNKKIDTLIQEQQKTNKLLEELKEKKVYNTNED